MSIIRFDQADPDGDSSFNRLSYHLDSGNDCSKDNKRGYYENEYAPYISHMHYEYLDGVHWLFGGTTTNNWATD